MTIPESDTEVSCAKEKALQKLNLQKSLSLPDFILPVSQRFGIPVLDQWNNRAAPRLQIPL
jgi:hypothetical protein